jgi:hypothetical protein
MNDGSHMPCTSNIFSDILVILSPSNLPSTALSSAYFDASVILVSPMTPVKSRNKTLGSVPLNYLVLGVFCFIILGVYLTAMMMPAFEDINTGPGTNSLFTRHVLPLSQKLNAWLSVKETETDFQPTWNEEFWTPIDVEVEQDSMITLCKLNFREYWNTPHLYPMFRDLVELSGCRGDNRRRERMSVLLKEIADKEGTPGGRVLTPTGFVFHESRVGSTLIANTLASDPWALVFSESAPMSNAILLCDHCSRKKHKKLIRDVATLMGHSPFHKHLFFKFQSITSTKMDVVLEVNQYAATLFLSLRFIFFFLSTFCVLYFPFP